MSSCSHSNELQLLGGGARACEPWSARRRRGDIPQPRSSSSAISLHTHPTRDEASCVILPPKLCSGRDGRCSPPDDITSPSGDNVIYMQLCHLTLSRELHRSMCVHTNGLWGGDGGIPPPRPPARPKLLPQPVPHPMASDCIILFVTPN